MSVKREIKDTDDYRILNAKYGNNWLRLNGDRERKKGIATHSRWFHFHRKREDKQGNTIPFPEKKREKRQRDRQLKRGKR